MEVFLQQSDYDVYLHTLREQTRRRRVEVWAYCLMPNHVHLILVPADRVGLGLALAEAHRRHAERINRREGWRGHLWQERFWSFPMDEPYLLAAVRYVLLNPVRAGLVEHAEEWPFSSAASHLRDRRDPLVETEALACRVEDWRRFLEAEDPEPGRVDLRHHASTGRPLGDAAFVARIEKLLGRRLRPGAPGRPRNPPLETSEGLVLR